MFASARASQHHHEGATAVEHALRAEAVGAAVVAFSFLKGVVSRGPALWASLQS